MEGAILRPKYTGHGEVISGIVRRFATIQSRMGRVRGHL